MIQVNGVPFMADIYNKLLVLGIVELTTRTHNENPQGAWNYYNYTEAAYGWFNISYCIDFDVSP